METIPPIAAVRPLRPIAKPQEHSCLTQTNPFIPYESIDRPSSTQISGFSTRVNPFAKRKPSKPSIEVITLDDGDEPTKIKEEVRTPSPKAKRVKDEIPDQDEYVAKFKTLNIVLIDDASRQMKFSVGTKRFLIQVSGF